MYTREEADLHKIPYREWFLVDGVGQWGLSTDGMVVECLAIRKVGKGGLMYEFSAGRVMRGSRVFEVMPRVHLRDWWGLTPGWWVEREKTKERTKRVVQAYVTMMLGPGKVDWAKLGNIYRPDQQIPEATVRRLFKQKEIQSMVTDEMKDALKKAGISKDFVLEKIKRALEIAENKGDAGNMLRATENLSEMLEMRPEGGGGAMDAIPLGSYTLPTSTVTEYQVLPPAPLPAEVTVGDQ
jgi:hypothetical protein